MNSGKRTKPAVDRLVPVLALIAGIAALSLSSGCARKPWRQPVSTDQYGSTLELLAEMRQDEAERSNCIDGDVDIFFTSTVKNRAVSGYMQLMQPTSVKFVTSNPLGQPVVAFVSDGQTFQFVNTMDALFMDGSLASFARTYDIPTVAYSSDWGTWLTGRLPMASKVTEIREDEKKRGIWISMTSPATKTGGTRSGAIGEHVLIDPTQRRIVERAFTSSNGSIEARINYDDLQPEIPGGAARQPGKITITGLDYSGRLILYFKDLQTVEDCRPSDFRLTRPSRYHYQPLPPE